MRFTLFGAAPDTGNLGVSALCYSTLYQLAIHDPALDITVFDYSRGHRENHINFGDKPITRFRSQGAIYSRRFYRPENLRFMQFAGFFGGLGNAGIKTIQQSDAVLDISGGDSFTDLYGQRCFAAIALTKLLAIQQKRPLVLLPQTYGPFTNKSNERKAAEIVKRCHSAWARDARSFEVLRNLLGESYDPSTHQCGVDVAFGLPALRPKNIPQDLLNALSSKTTKIGINISGLIYNNFSSGAKHQFKFRADYPIAVLNLIKRFLKETDNIIILIPHVVTPAGDQESDVDACRDIFAQLANQHSERILIVCPAYENPCHIKWVISKLDWFCGTRMHATIAALSSGIPTAAISYSPKTIGVFETCEQGENVADPQTLDTHDLVEALWSSWQAKQEVSVLDVKLCHIREMVDKQIINILSSTTRLN